MMTRSKPRRERAIIAVLRTGRIPGQNVTQLEFCGLVRAAARIEERSEGFPRGWSRATIMSSASKITGSPAMLCERCKTEITLAKLLDAEPDVNRRRRELAVGGERRVLPPTAWALFETLYAARGEPVSGEFLRRQSAHRVSGSTCTNCAEHSPGPGIGWRDITTSRTS